MNSKPPSISKSVYQQIFHGIFGQFGTGANTRIFYVQTAIKFRDLEKIKLISDIPGSEKWSIKELFQREVDTKRVEKEIVPYFRDTKKVKFFSPLIITLLPIADLGEGNSIISRTPKIIERKGTVEHMSGDYEILEYEGYFRFGYSPGEPWGFVEWNDLNITPVAIDGQHRLCALKYFFSLPSNEADLQSWSIPIVIFSVKPANKAEEHLPLINVVRNIFIVINKEAKPPSEARQIILNDESINNLCVQELLEYSHENDVKEIDQRDPEKMPLYLYNWRDISERDDAREDDTTLLRIVELRSWLERYVIGEDFSSDGRQKKTFEIDPSSPLNHLFNQNNPLSVSYDDAQKIIEIFKDKIMPGITYLLENIEPYKKLIKNLRSIEEEFCKDAAGVHAFYRLRFGSDQAIPSMRREVDEQYKKLVYKLKEEINKLPKLIKNLIGMRGIIYSFGRLKSSYDKLCLDNKVRSNWREFSKWFTALVNEVLNDNWLEDIGKGKGELLKHIVYNEEGQIINYRLEDVEQGLGSYLTIIIATYGRRTNENEMNITDSMLEEDFNDEWSNISNVLRRGYRRVLRPKLKLNYPMGGTELTKAVNERAAKEAKDHIDRIKKALQQVCDQNV